MFQVLFSGCGDSVTEFIINRDGYISGYCEIKGYGKVQENNAELQSWQNRLNERWPTPASISYLCMFASLNVY